MPEETSSTNFAQSDRHAAKIARMVQPESLKSGEYQPWSRGRGVDVWAMLCASITGDLATIRDLAARDPNLIECEYEYFRPIRFAVRENQRAIGWASSYCIAALPRAISRWRAYVSNLALTSTPSTQNGLPCLWAGRRGKERRR